MENVLTTNDIKDEERPGWEMKCPKCSKDIMYTVLKIASGEDVYLLCDRCSNFTLRDEDRLSNQFMNVQNELPQLDKLRMLYEKLEHDLPKCDCGGSFRIWSNVKCPNCAYEFPYNNGVKDEEVRFLETTIIWIRKAIAYRGYYQQSNRLVEVNIRKK